MLRFYELVSAALENTKPEGGRVQQEALAKKLGCFQTTISAYLRGASLPPVSRLPLYAEVLEIPVERLTAIVTTDRAVPRKRLVRLATEFHRGRRTDPSAVA